MEEAINAANSILTTGFFDPIQNIGIYVNFDKMVAVDLEGSWPKISLAIKAKKF